MLLCRTLPILLICGSLWAQTAPRSPQPAAAAIYQKVLEDAEKARDRGELKGALAAFRSLAEGKVNEIAPELRARAVKDALDVQLTLDRQESSPWRVILRLVSWPAKVLVSLIVLTVPFLIYRYRLVRSPRPATRVSFEDLSEPRETRLASSRVLTNNLRDLLQNPTPVQMSALHVDLMPGTDEAGFSGLSPTLAMEALLGFEPSDQPVKVVSVEFSLRDLIGFLSSLFSRPYEQYLDGWLDTRGDQVEAFAELRTPGGRAPNEKWRVKCVGAGARERAIADLAAKIVVGTGKSTMTGNWQSFRNFHEALKLRFSDGAKRADEDSPSSRTYLERALAFDAANWIARFNLGLALCRDNQSLTALEHFRILERVFTEVWARAREASSPALIPAGKACSRDQVAFQSVLRHVQEYPECPFLVLYNKAIALSNLDGSNHTLPALEILQNIGGLMDRALDSRFEFPHNEIAERLSTRCRTELALYGLSARANILAGIRTGVCPAAGSRLREIYDSSPEEIRAITEQIRKVCLQEQEQHWQSLQTARAVSLTALARVLAVQSREVEAERHLHEALAAEPGLVAGYLHLAELYMRCRQKLSATWASEADWLLRHTLELSPGCGQATYLLGSLYTHPLVGRSEEAEVLFRRLKTNSEACLRVAKITADRAEAGESLVWLKRHIVLSRGLTDDAAGILEQLLSLHGMNAGETSNWRALSEALGALSGDLAGQETHRISKFLAKIKDRQRPDEAIGAGVGS